MKEFIMQYSDMMTQELSVRQISMNMIVALVLGLVIYLSYRFSHSGAVYSQRFNVSLLMMTLITTMIMNFIFNNIALSLGMVGALSIVRFRTAVKDPVDTIFMFWAIAVGIMSGAGLYLITIIACALLGLFYLISYFKIFKPIEKYLLVVNTDKENALEVSKIFANKNCTLKTESIKKDKVELTYEIIGKEFANEILKLKDDKLQSIHMISID